ncbi:hypothetical protein GLOTRDRAFT_15981, partial [Gloeophyllum trabeum ATCC 11539]
VPVLDGLNWPLWSQQMKAYLMSQGLWGHCDGTITMPDTIVPTYKDGSTSQDTSAQEAWRLNDTKAIGTIRLRSSPAVATLIQSKTMAKETWDELNFTYGISSLASIYNELRGTVPNCHQGLICLNALPPQYDSLIQVLVQ